MLGGEQRLDLRARGENRAYQLASLASAREGHAVARTAQRMVSQPARLGRLDASTSAADMNLPGWDWHPLKGDLAGHWAVKVSGNWRLTFTFDGKDAVLVDYQDYH